MIWVILILGMAGIAHDSVATDLRLFRHARHAAFGIINWIDHYRNVALGGC